MEMETSILWFYSPLHRPWTKMIKVNEVKLHKYILNLASSVTGKFSGMSLY